ncbi:MAG: 5-(carboxyamino)imidazole ribonucleotide synthase [Bacteroidetes bacterium]|nr:5-(carboxyamino)imidazole ribonucleotide synthase [Bacteroidota bacterium]
MQKRTIGVVGGGQLCLMMGEAIRNRDLPYKLIAIDPTPDCPAHPFLEEQVVGDYKDEDQIRRLGERADILTFEIELANSKVLNELSRKGKPVHPSPETLRIIQDKFTQADFLRAHDIPVPDFQKMEGEADLQRVMREYGLPLMVKARKDSYDGRGNFVVRRESDAAQVFSYFNGIELMAQRYIPFDLEVSVISARGIDGQIANFPVGENIHGADYNILKTTIVPARVSESVITRAEKVASDAMEALNGAGVFGIEMFVVKGEVLINEIAPRVHNSGHYTIEACRTSQFEQHLRAIAGNKLGDTGLISGPAVMYNIIGREGQSGSYRILYDGAPVTGTVQVEESVCVHNYGKHEVKPYRKMGHFTVLSLNGETQNELIRRAERIKDKVEITGGEK